MVRSMCAWPLIIIGGPESARAPNPTPHFFRSRRLKTEAQEQEWFEAEAILETRTAADGTATYLVQWKPHAGGTEYEPTWEPKDFLSSSLLRSFHGAGLALPPIMVTLDARPLVARALNAIALALAIAKTQARPRVHLISLPEICLPSLGRAFLEAIASPSTLRSAGGGAQVPLPIATSTGSDGVVTEEVVMKEVADISLLCGFEHHFAGKATGLLRYDMGRESNHDMMSVGMPMLFQVSTNRASGLVTTTVQFPTVHWLGATGRPQPPMAIKGMLTETKNISKLVRIVRSLTPPTHPLAEHGWTTLPDHVHELANPINFPEPAPP